LLLIVILRINYGDFIVTLDEFNKLEVGDHVKYGPFAGVKFSGVESGGEIGTDHVIMIDGIGDTKKVYKDLFIKHGQVI
jgi:hypothetical protein